MKDLTISSLPLQNLILESCRIAYLDFLIQLPLQPDIEKLRVVKEKLLQLETLISELEKIIKNNEA